MSTLAEDIDLIRREVRDWHTSLCAGMSAEMRDEDDWRLIDSTIKESSVAAFEQQLPSLLPQSYRAFLLSYHASFLDFGEYSLPNLRHDERLGESLELLLHPEFWGVGYMQIGWASGCGDPLVMDFKSATPDGDYPICVFNHDIVPEDCWGDRELLEPWKALIAGSFREFFLALLHGDDGIFPRPRAPEEQRRNVAWEEVERLLKEKGLPSYHRPDGVPKTDPWKIAEFVRSM